MDNLFNWGGETSEQRKARTEWEQEILLEQARMRAMTMTGGVGGGSAGFNVPVESSIVAGATVIIGWTDSLRYTDKDGQVYLISQTDESLDDEIHIKSIIEVVQTGQSGIASFSSFNSQWKIDDYTRFYADQVSEPETYYAPIETIGGTAVGAGYNIAPMQSNAGFARVNPITSLLTTVSKYTLPNDGGEADLIVSRVEEWINIELTEKQKEDVKIGIAEPDVYSQLIQPIVKINDLFSGLSITDRPISVELDDREKDSSIEITLSSIAATAVSAIYDFASYFSTRNSGGSIQTANQWAKDNTDNGTLAEITGYEIETDSRKAIIDLLYDEDTTSTDFRALPATYPSLQPKTGPGDGPKVPGFLANIYEASTTSGLRFYTDEDVVETLGVLQVSLIYRSAKGQLTYFPAAVTKNSDKDYTIDVLTTMSTSAFMEGTYTVEVVLTTSKTQTSNSVTYSSKGGFTDSVTGAVINPLKDSEPPKGNTISAYMVGAAITLTLTETGAINKNPVYYTSHVTGDLYVYWSGDRWVADNDTNPGTGVYASGPKDGSLTGDYTDKGSNIQLQISQ